VVSRAFLVYFALGILPFLCGALHPGFLGFGYGYVAFLVLLLLLDHAWMPLRGDLSVSRTAPRTATFGRPVELRFDLENRSSRTARFELCDSPPVGLETDGLEISAQLPPGGRIEMVVQAQARARGDFCFGPVHLRLRGLLGLAVRQWTVEAPHSLRVFPDLTGADARVFHTSRGLLRESGARASSQLGQGREFDHLRAYVPGDEFRSIDWKATARKDRLVAREYRSERNQHVMILLDAGRRMTAAADGASRLDHAIQAALQLVHLGLMRGDHVGIMVFADSVKAFVAPARGRRQLHRIAQRLVPIQPELCEPDYDVAFNMLALKVRRRSLVVMFTELLDSESSKVLLHRLGRLVPRHLPLCVSIADPDIPRAMLKPVKSLEDVFDKAVARELHMDTQLTLRSLETMGAHVVHVPADRLTAATLRRYMDIKHRGLL